jgi:7-cyano-7-deazaguanine synthase
MRTNRTPAVVLVSGGMDSCVTAALAAELHEELAFLHVNYGQRTEAREGRAFREIADHYGVRKRLVMDLTVLKAIGGSSLTDHGMPVTPADLTATGIPTSYVPFRNAHLLCAAVSWAEVLGADRIYIGAVEEDSSGYPDCRRAFFDAFETAANLGTKPDTRLSIVTPIIGMKKKDIILQGLALKAPLRLTWSCYTNEDEACGECDSCALRLRGFQQAGVEDPIPYRKRPG